MAKPEPKPIHQDELVALAPGVLKADKFPVLATFPSLVLVLESFRRRASGREN